jgi:hypothetical protein
VSLPVFTSHSLIVLSPLAEASVWLSGLNATAKTWPSCPFRVAVFLPLATSQSLAVFSMPPEASSLPSGLNDTEETASVCP